MKLPSLEECSKDQFLFTLRSEDERGFLATKNRKGNQAFLMRKRFIYAFELIKKYLSQDIASIKVADFACGTGNVGLLFAEAGYSVDFVDNEEKFFEYIKLKHTDGVVHFQKGDCSNFVSETKYDVIFFGEALEHMSQPAVTLSNLRENLKTGGLLCLTTPNGDFVNCYEPSWSEVKDQKERNEKLANSIGNHVCEFTKRELSELVKTAGFNMLEHKTFLSDQISRKSLLRRIVPERAMWKLDDYYSKQKNSAGKDWGRTQIVIAQRAH
jgi:2-polyprenyl-3-methyl-5-hydroxy-6-metoxy-1,4-benzoquinol methylase